MIYPERYLKWIREQEYIYSLLEAYREIARYRKEKNKDITHVV